MDYISARTLFRNECYDEFLIFCQQCIEKYLKAILLYNDVKDNSMHSLNKLLKKCTQLSLFKISERTQKFINEVDGYDKLRYGAYIFGSFWAERKLLLELDYAVMDLRRYCTSDIEFSEALSKVSEDELIHLTKRGGFTSGLLQTIQKSRDPKHSLMHSNLFWKNLYFSPKVKSIKFQSGWWGKGSGLQPKEMEEMYRAVEGYVLITKEVRQYFSNLRK